MKRSHNTQLDTDALIEKFNDWKENLNVVWSTGDSKMVDATNKVLESSGSKGEKINKKQI